jgi:peptidoglycan/xylan/chitin deacetylase (PgdA/CDA1 family)
MEPDRLTYSPITTRPPLIWPNGARVALWVVPNIEHYEYLPVVRSRNPWPRMPHPDVLGYGSRDYGNRIGLWRMMEVMDRLEIRCTISLNLAVYEHYPEIMQACEARRWEIMSHGLYNTQYVWNLPEDEERALIADCVATHKRLTGRDLPGWFSPAASYTLNTADLCAEAGIVYHCDWYHDDQPTPFKTRSGRLISIPYTMDINDHWITRHPLDGEEFAQMAIDQFDQLWRDAADGSGRVMCVALHPYIMGQPHRIGHLERALKHMVTHSGVWQATGLEIAQHYIEHCLPAVEAHLAAEAPARAARDQRAGGRP